MNYKVNWSKRSLNDLDLIYDTISEYSSSKANKIIKAIFDKSNILYDHPRIGQRETLLVHRDKEFRYLVYQYYKIIYVVFDQYVTVYTVFDTRQHPDKLRNQ